MTQIRPLRKTLETLLDNIFSNLRFIYIYEYMETYVWNRMTSNFMACKFFSFLKDYGLSYYRELNMPSVRISNPLQNGDTGNNAGETYSRYDTKRYVLQKIVHLRNMICHSDALGEIQMIN